MGLSGVTFYTTQCFSLRDELRSAASADFLNPPPVGSLPEDPRWTGTPRAESVPVEKRDRSSDESPPSARSKRRRKLNVRRAANRPAVVPNVGLRILEAASISRNPTIDAVKFPHAATGFVGRDDRSDVRKLRACPGASAISIDGITQEESMRLLDPRCPQAVRHLVSERSYKYIVNDINVAQAFADSNEYVYAVKVQQPHKGWDQVYGRAEKAFAVIAEHYALELHRRGRFKTHTFGIAMGNGSSHPHPLDQTADDEMLREAFLLEVESYAKHFTASAKLWMPRLMEHYSDLQLELMGINSMLMAVFPGSPFCALTINMGPQTVCLPHRDYWNLAYGTCPIGVLGHFDHRTGGQLILHEPKLIIELRRGDVMFIPSASVTHENAPIVQGEERYSFTQYTAGGLFRYVWCNGRLAKDLRGADAQRYKDGGEKRWEDGWARYSTMEELIERMKPIP